MGAKKAISRRDFLRLSTALAAGAVAAACAPAAPQIVEVVKEVPVEKVVKETVEVEKVVEKVVTGVPPRGKPVTLLYVSPLTADVELKWTHYWVDAWNEARPDIQVRIEDVGWAQLPVKIKAYLAAGEPLDIATGVTAERYKMGWVEPLDEWLGDIKGLWIDMCFLRGSGCVYYEGDEPLWIGVPLYSGGEALMVRKDYLGEAGITDIMAATATWDDVKETAKKIYDPPNVYAWCHEMAEGASISHVGAVLLQMNGLIDLSDFRPEKRDAYIEALKWMQEMWEFASPDSLSWQWRDKLTGWATGMIGMMVMGTSMYGDLVPRAPELLSPEKMGILPLANGPSGPGRQMRGGVGGHWIFKQSKHKAECAEFMRFMSEGDQHNSFPMNLSCRKDVEAKRKAELLTKFYPDWYGPECEWWFDDWFSLFDNYPVFMRAGYMPSEEINKLFMDQVVELWRNSTTPEEMYDTLKPKIEAIRVK